MKYTLKDYQAEAVDKVLTNLEKARSTYRRDGAEVAFSLTAATGAGKTVMAAASIEALFYGSDTFEFDPDPGAVVIWFSDSPALNEQSRTRLMQASEKLMSGDLVTIKPPFAIPELEAGKVYFLNTQRLSKNSLLTRGYVPTADEIFDHVATPDDLAWNIWETIGNTISNDDKTLYLVLDEAHRGFDTKTSSDRKTIVQRLVNGEGNQPPIPIVMGISATIDRFAQAMKEAQASDKRQVLDQVAVHPWQVQESGLVKDTVMLDIPDEVGNFDSVLVRRAARKLKESTTVWHAYSKHEGLADVVEPLLVVQVPNVPEHDDVGVALDTIADELGGLPSSAVRHVLGDHKTQTFGSWDIDHIEPQRVQDTPHVKVLIAKDGISTGWDCPRAEVLVSFRPAKDHTHITQLLGRMVRNPLARRVPGDERLNSVDCILPFFDKTMAGKVVKYMTGQIEEVGGTSSRKVVIEPHEMSANPNVGEAVWKVWDALPSLSVPVKGARPVKRLVALAQALSSDGLRNGALAEIESKLHTVLDEFADQYPDLLASAVNEVWEVHVLNLVATTGKAGVSYRQFVERADARAIRVAFEDAKRAFGADIAQSYVDHLAGPDDEDADDDGLTEAYVKAAALAYIPELRKKIDAVSESIAKDWFAEYSDAIETLNDERQEQYLEIWTLATVPQPGKLRRPRNRIEDWKMVDASEQIVAAPLAELHLMSDADGWFPIGTLNEWERKVLSAELASGTCLGWYRNPARAAVDALGVTYRDVLGNWRSMHPDFLFFHEVDGEVKVSIIDPHGHHLDDALVKLKGLAEFARDYGKHFHRIEAIANGSSGSALRSLDLKNPGLQRAILDGAGRVVDFYDGEFAIEYSGPAK
ncbi:DEAD/DEAH box helicase [Microbacterium sp. C7(2022)]|uniref:DEAD/DEAH box helicase n=1 Tax=Microbacterium sp. C7(2022) TaxID=2992759 RepID=UPI00237C4D39|nr:DEAD/DEAH box helicase family protein [Microbacterium sp. C7(2022)]MDE0547437.1 DEAD/DEAH box helicase family protein [Microbacterium sp. C7(2022)]